MLNYPQHYEVYKVISALEIIDDVLSEINVHIDILPLSNENAST
jgi:hypothetical protein